MAITKIGDSQSFSYTGNIQSFTAPFEGLYKLDVYGGRGGGSMTNGSVNSDGGQGGHSVGYKKLTKGQVIYVVVGGAGTNGRYSNAPGGYNGGGYGTWDNSDDEGAGGGGGATHIATKTGLLSTLSNDRATVLIVAGGGGGKAWKGSVSNGGGLSVTTRSGKAVNQTSGYAFGQGQNASGTGESNGVGGAGGGWYGGYCQWASDSECGDGGSGYIDGCPSITYNSKSYSSTSTSGGNTGNGNATITLTDSVHTITVTAETGGTVSGGGTYSLNSSRTVTAIPSSEYNFDGWYKGETKVSSSRSYTFTLTESVSLVAKFTIKTFVVTFNPNGGITPINSITVTLGKAYGELPIPSRQFYRFKGWFTSASGGSEITKDTIVNLDKNQTLYALWKPRILVGNTEIKKIFINGNVPIKVYYNQQKWADVSSKKWADVSTESWEQVSGEYIF